MIGRELRLAVRRLATAPVAALTSTALLALGIGATVALSTIINALVFRPLPVPQPDRLVVASIVDRTGQVASMGLDTFLSLADQPSAFEAMAGVLPSGISSISVDGHARQAAADAVTADYFRVLGVPPLLGRTLGPADFSADGREASAVCVVSYELWQQVYGGRADALGRTIRISESACEVVGVMPRGFGGAQTGVAIDIVAPLPLLGPMLGMPPDRPPPLSQVLARLRVGVSLAEARAELNLRWTRALEATRPPDMTSFDGSRWFARRLQVSSGATGFSYLRDRYAGPLGVLLAGTALLLVMASANVAGFQLAVGLRRVHEVGLRRALGASRWQVLRPLLVESALVAVAGAAIGLLIASGGAEALMRLLLAGTFSTVLDTSADVRLWLLVCGVAVSVTLLSGLLPAWIVTRSPPSPGSAQGRIVPAGRWSRALVVLQVAVSAALLAGAGVVTAAMADLAARDLGFTARGVAVAQLYNRPGGYLDLDDEAYYRTLADRLSALPGVRSAVLVSGTPGMLEFRRPVRRADGGGPANATASIIAVSPGYFATLGVPLLGGRDVAWSDTIAQPPVAVISRSLASLLFPSDDVIGEAIVAGPGTEGRQATVVGVAEDASVLDVRSHRPPIVYLAMAQQPAPIGRWPRVLMRTDGALHAIEQATIAAVDGLGREHVVSFRPLDVGIGMSLARERLLGGLSVLYGLIALALVGVGLTALLSYDVAARTRELGVRLAVGASPWNLQARVVLRGLGLTVLGVIAGIPLAVAARAALVDALGGTAASSVVAAAAGCLVLVAVGAISTIVPGRRASRVDPATALRAE
jgi:predicted permease